MGFVYRKRVRAGRRTWINLSRSGVSASERIGPVTVNSRGKVRVRLFKRLSWRS